MYTLGINGAFHDPAACLVRDGVVLAAAEEERFTHVKHGKRPIPFSTYELPFHAIDYCLGEAGIRLLDVDHVAYSFDPFILLGRRRNDATITLPLELEDTVVEIARWLHQETGQEDLCMAGGVALNCVMNARVRDRGPFKNVWVQPAAGDAGTALGAALWIDAKERRSGPTRPYVMHHAFLGPAYADEEIEAFLM